jgi:adenine-specific DNA-methyltransferase
MGIDLMRDKSGVMALIAQNNWVTSFGASKMRNKVINDTQILNLIDFGDYKVFDTAGIQTMVILFKKNNTINEYTFDFRRLSGDKLTLSDVIDLLSQTGGENKEYLQPAINRKSLNNKTLTFANNKIDSILNTISERSNFKLDPSKEVAQGIVCPQDNVNKSSQRALGNDFKVGDGIFILSDEELSKLKLSQKDRSLIKPLFTTEELKKWYGKQENRKWIIYTDSRFKRKEIINEFEGIKAHLDQFNKVITSDNKPYGLHRSRDEYFFKGEKIISLRKCTIPTFTYTDFDSYVSATFYVIKTERINQKYLVALLNSKLMAFLLKNKGKMQGNNYQIDKEPLMGLPIYVPPKEEQESISKKVSQIIELKKSSDYKSNEKKLSLVSDYEKQIDQIIYQFY